MIIPISIRYKYKNYPNAPKATGKSKSLGVMTSLTAMIMWSFLFLAIMGGMLSAIGLEDNVAYIIGAVLLIPFIYGILKWKKHCIQKIDKAAAAESIRMLSMTPGEKAMMAQKMKKKRTIIALYLLGSIFLLIVTLIIIEIIR